MSFILLDNFNLISKKPLDKRQVVDSLNDILLPYEGLITFQTSPTKKFFKYVDGQWSELFKDIEDAINNLETLIQNGAYTLFKSVKNYNVMGDGVTNDTINIQNAINDISTLGGILFFPKGTYLTSEITVKNNVFILGESQNSTIIKRINSTTQHHFITGLNVNNFSFDSITIDGSKTDSHNYLYCDTMNLIGCGNFSINNCYFKNSVNRGLYVEKNTDINSVTDSIIKECIFDGNGSAGAWFLNASDIHINNNIIKNNADNGIVCTYDVNKYTFSKIEFDNNYVSSNPQIGIWCYTGLTDRTIEIGEITISNNDVFSNGTLGIVTQLNETLMVNNKVHDNGNATIDHAGITINSNNCSIIGGSVNNNSGPAIDLGDCYDILIQNVLMKENGTMAIEVNSCERVIIDGCIMKYNNRINDAVQYGTNNGITIYQGTDGSGNPFSGVSKDIQVKNCIIRRNSSYYQGFGIFVESTSQNVMLTGNDLYDSGNTLDLKVQTQYFMGNNNILKNYSYNEDSSVILLASGATSITIPPSGDVFFIDLASGASGVNIVNLLNDGVAPPKGRKVTLVLVSPYITLKSTGGNLSHANQKTYSLTGTSPNYTLTTNTVNNPDISGYLATVEYVSLGGSGNGGWIEVTHSLGR